MTTEQPQPEEQSSSKGKIMGTIALVWGLFVLVGAGIALIPCLGFIGNVLVIPIAIGGLIFCCIATAAVPPPKTPAVTGLICCLVGGCIGVIRLIISVIFGGL